MYTKLLRKLALSFALLFSTGLYAQKADIEVRDIVKGSYLDYYPSDIKKDIISVNVLEYLDWVGKAYADKNKITEQTMLSRAEKNAEDFAIGYGDGYLSRLDKDYDPSKYYMIIDHYEVKFKESDYKFSTVVTGNIILIKK